MDSLNTQLDVSQRIIAQHDQTIRRQDTEIIRLENAFSNRPFTSVQGPFEAILEPVKKPVARKIEMSSVLQELEDKFSSGLPLLKRTSKPTIVLEDLIREIDLLAM